VWVVEFKAWVRFRKVTSVSKATHVKVSTPTAFTAEHAIAIVIVVIR
jgi:hypothetical protein